MLWNLYTLTLCGQQNCVRLQRLLDYGVALSILKHGDYTLEQGQISKDVRLSSFCHTEQVKVKLAQITQNGHLLSSHWQILHNCTHIHSQHNLLHLSN